jgi:tetratricopeptide (TPR) repeat protein
MKIRCHYVTLEDVLMKIKLLLVFFSLMILGGCMTSKYMPAEQHLERKKFNQALRTYLKFLQPHMREGRRYIYYEKEAVTGIGIVYWNMQRYETAEKILNVVLEKDPLYGKALFYFGMTMEGQGREDDAIMFYKKYSEVDAFDPYRQVMKSRLDYIAQNKILREVRLALQNEAQLNIEDLSPQSVGIFYFLSLSEDPKWKPLQKGLAEMMISDLNKIEGIQVAERRRVDAIMNELRLETANLIDDDITPRIGKLIGARNLIKGSYLVMPDLKMTLDAGIYEATSMSFPASIDFDGNLSRIFKMEKELVLRIIDYLNIDLTIQQRNQILELPTENMMAFMSYCRGLDALDKNNFLEAQEHFREALNFDHNYQLAMDWLIIPEIWNVTHSRNIFRVNFEVAKLIKTTGAGRSKMVYTPPAELVSPWNRLQWIGMKQNTGFLPTDNYRKSFQEAEILGAPVVPRILGEPPAPPSN